MKNFKTYYLEPLPSQQKSFYKKAQVIELDNGDRYLQSYNTIVCGIVQGKFEKYWNDWSVTTSNHINAFIGQYTELNRLSKKEWLSLETNELNTNIPHLYFDYCKHSAYYPNYYL